MRCHYAGLEFRVQGVRVLFNALKNSVGLRGAQGAGFCLRREAQSFKSLGSNRHFLTVVCVGFCFVFLNRALFYDLAPRLDQMTRFMEVAFSRRVQGRIYSCRNLPSMGRCCADGVQPHLCNSCSPPHMIIYQLCLTVFSPFTIERL